MDKLDLDADNFLSKMEEQSDEAPLVSTNFETDTFKGIISFRVPEVVKGAKSKRVTISLKRILARRKVLKRKVLIVPFYPYVFITNMLICSNLLITEEDSNNVAENSYERVDSGQFSVRLLTLTAFI
jgi:hypothetical protein